MSSSIANMACVKGQIVRLHAKKKRGHMTEFERAGIVAAAALSRGLKSNDHFAVRYDRRWALYQVNYPHPVRKDLTEDAAAMLLMHKAMSRG